MDILNLTLTGKLTADATETDVQDKSVINFTVANNLSSDNTVFWHCAYWIKKKDELAPNPDGKKTLTELLTKGKSVVITSNSITLDMSKDKDEKVYHKLKLTVSKINLS